MSFYASHHDEGAADHMDGPAPPGAAAAEIRSSLVAFLLQQWSWGLMSASLAQQICMHAKSDIEKMSGLPCTCAQLNAVAAIGTSGRHANNAKRDLLRLVQDMTHITPTTVPIPVNNSRGTNAAMSKLTVLLPHVLFSQMFNNYLKAFVAKVCASRDALQTWWTSQERNPQLHGHPLHQRVGFERRAVPLRLHGDGVAITGIGKNWAQNATIFSWCSFLAQGVSQNFNWHIWSVYDIVSSYDADTHTRDCFWRILCWSLRWLWLGLWPDADWNGVAFTKSEDIDRALTPLAGPADDFLFGVVWGELADLEYHWKEMGLNNYNSVDPCFCCPANLVPGRMNTNEFRLEHADWVTRVYTKDDWRDSPYNTHAFFSLPGVSILTACVDFMHTKYLGVDGYFYASVLVVLVYHVLPQDPQTNLNIVWKYLQAECKSMQTGTSIRRLLLSTFSNKLNPHGSMPNFKAKAAVMKGLARPLASTFRHFAKVVAALPAIQITQICMALDASATLDEIIDDNPDAYVFDDATYASFKEAGFKYMVLFNALGRFYSEVHRPALKLFNITIKAHLLCHCVLQAEFVNPRLGWCFYGEDFMQKMRKLLQVCAHSNGPRQAMNEVHARYRCALHVLFHEIAAGHK